MCGWSEWIDRNCMPFPDKTDNLCLFYANVDLLRFRAIRDETAISYTHTHDTQLSLRRECASNRAATTGTFLIWQEIDRTTLPAAKRGEMNIIWQQNWRSLAVSPASDSIASRKIAKWNRNGPQRHFFPFADAMRCKYFISTATKRRLQSEPFWQYSIDRETKNDWTKQKGLRRQSESLRRWKLEERKGIRLLVLCVVGKTRQLIFFVAAARFRRCVVMAEIGGKDEIEMDKFCPEKDAKDIFDHWTGIWVSSLHRPWLSRRPLTTISRDCVQCPLSTLNVHNERRRVNGDCRCSNRRNDGVLYVKDVLVHLLARNIISTIVAWHFICNIRRGRHWTSRERGREREFTLISQSFSACFIHTSTYLSSLFICSTALASCVSRTEKLHLLHWCECVCVRDNIIGRQ